MHETKVDAVLFDFDGTLADTMVNHYICWKKVLEKFDVSLMPEDYYPMEGASLYKIVERFLEGNLRRKPNRSLQKKELYIDLSKKKINVLPWRRKYDLCLIQIFTPCDCYGRT